MNTNLLIPLLITSGVTIFGWFIIHVLISNRDRINKQRDLKINYLIEAWRKLESASNRENKITSEQESDIESAIADIQLFGSKKQIVLARKFVEEFVKNKTAELNELLHELRQDLRKEINLEETTEKISHIRIFRNS